MKFFILLFLLFCFSVNAATALSFKETQVQAKASLGQKIVKVVFEAKNAQESSVVIEAAKVTCDCMWMTTKFPLTVKPGESVKLEAEYDTTGKLGLNRGRILVDVNGKNETLQVEIDIPVAVTVSPRFLIWQKDSRIPKKVVVTLHPDWQGSIDEAVSKDSQVKTVMVKNDTGLSVTITPEAALGKKRTWVIIKGKDAEGKAIENRVYLIFN